MLDFHVIGAAAVREIISRSRPEIVARVRQAYLAHHDGIAVNPDSQFLRFPDRPDCRIIALPAYTAVPQSVAGIKWVSSFPSNVAANVQRASAVLILNDPETGHPFACLEAAQISAARTAASAALAAEVLTGGRTAHCLAVVGAGVIARTIVEFLASASWRLGHVAVHDLVDGYARSMAAWTAEHGYESSVAPTLEAALHDADLTVLATTAATPHISDPGLFAPGRVVLNISLRDIAPEIIRDACNVVDDVEHCLRAGTSPHLAVLRYGHRNFVAGTLAGVMRGEVALAPDRPVVFSPFGLGVLDLVVGHHVYRVARAEGRTLRVPNFLGETERWRDGP